ncbi:hypothetical protein ES288_D12G078800v1 [Gossypium darwinii]|uniref:Uncharacterized protein n=1 Tax=Gossypium darwinii TaxID=34276 RepID=A0A5D2A848_GOSDA|nr:hypothetical protein ES288_D12G078800v1 [Gossypium darwinii]
MECHNNFFIHVKFSNFWGNDTKIYIFFTPEKLFYDELYTDWSFINELKRRNFRKEFIKRVKSLDKESFDLGIPEKRTRFSNNETKREYLPKLYSCMDPTAEESKNGVLL